MVPTLSVSHLTGLAPPPSFSIPQFQLHWFAASGKQSTVVNTPLEWPYLFDAATAFPLMVTKTEGTDVYWLREAQRVHGKPPIPVFLTRQEDDQAGRQWIHPPGTVLA